MGWRGEGAFSDTFTLERDGAGVVSTRSLKLYLCVVFIVVYGQLEASCTAVRRHLGCFIYTLHERPI